MDRRWTSRDESEDPGGGSSVGTSGEDDGFSVVVPAPSPIQTPPLPWEEQEDQ